MKRPAKLKEKITAYNFQVRGEVGETVYLRFKHGDVYIVENDKGQKYSVHKDKLEIDGGVSLRNNSEQSADADMD